jgi:L-ascorbate metabolism protein UlaG (beta-lactamase superfamily)
MKIPFFAFSFMCAMSMATGTFSQGSFEADSFKTTAGDLKITFLGHGSLFFTFNKKVIYIDPYSKVADYATLPKADLILITHDHQDHLDKKALESIKTKSSELILTQNCFDILKEGSVMKNGDIKTTLGITVEAVPAYNIVNKRENGQPFHPKGAGNGYVLTFGDKKVYIAGDTENIPEMKNLKNIHAAFLPMNLPFTMTPEMVADAVKQFSPKILYPYHTGETDISMLTKLMKGNKATEVRIRKMK